jgi:hypothetical protein
MRRCSVLPEGSPFASCWDNPIEDADLLSLIPCGF